MKLINHKKANYYTLGGYVMKGTIVLTREEFKKCTPFFNKTKPLFSVNGRFANYGDGNIKTIMNITGDKESIKKFKYGVNYGVTVI